MKVSFTGFVPQAREVELDESDLAVLNDLLRSVFINHVTYGTFSEGRSSAFKENRTVLELCEKYGVDGTYDKDRVAFFKAVLGE